MKIAYTIISVDESRRELKEKIRENMIYPEISSIKFVDGRSPGAIEAEVERYNCTVGSGFFYGELGVWFSQLNCWQWLAGSGYDALLVLEDDAVLNANFPLLMEKILVDLPEDFDFVSLSVPQNQMMDYYYDRRFLSDGGWELISHNRKRFTHSVHYIGSNVISTAYQGYACVATMYSRAGATKLIDIFKKKGIYTPVDCFLFLERNQGNLNGYAPTPNFPSPVGYLEKGTIARSTVMYS